MARAVRKTLHRLFPSTMGYGVLYPTPKIPGQPRPGYQMNLDRCPNPDDTDDAVFYTFLAHLDREKGLRKKRTKTKNDDNEAKKRKPTQVRIHNWPENNLK